MSWAFWLPLVVVGTSLLTGILIFALREEQDTLRGGINVAGALIKLAFVGLMWWAAAREVPVESRLGFLPGVAFVLRVDILALLFITLSAVLWLATTVYAIGYLEKQPHQSRFFGFFSLCVMSTMGIALAGNLLTFFIFYELLTVVTYPLVVHTGSRAALAAGRTYLLYTLGGGVVLLLGIAWLHGLAGPVEFTSGGSVAALAAEHRTVLQAIFGLMIAGLGVKAALVPLHGWLPEAMVAPAPVSALLHAVAVVKAGAFGIVRVVYDVFGIEVAAELGVLTPLALAASVTIIYGSLRAVGQNDLKRRLAYSTVSQLSYITLGTAILGPLATMGGLVHLMHQGIMKITLFFCVGIVGKELGITRVSEMHGVGRRMPITMAAFTLAAFGVIGMPPLAGFVSKWYLGLGGLAAGQGWVIAVLVASSLLNAAYFLPIVRTAWFDPFPDDRLLGRTGREASWTLVAPPVVTAAMALGAGLFAGTAGSPLGLAAAAVREIYAR